MADNFTSSFNISKADLTHILRQIKIAEATSAAYTSTPTSITSAIMAEYGLNAADAAIAPFGLRTVDGSFNSLVPGQSRFGAADTVFPRLTTPRYRNDADGDSIDFDGPGPNAPPVVQGNYGINGNIIDADPRIISNLVVDMSVNNPAAIEAFLNNPLSVDYYIEKYGVEPTTANLLIHPITNEDLQTIPNQSPDIGLSPGFNAWMTFFGQFFDHGLDLVTKGGNGTVYVPLQPDDPLIAGADGIVGDDPTTLLVNEGADDLPAQLRFMALTRATPKTEGGVTGQENTTTSFVDQNQTYTSHASHQVFLREYALNAAGRAVSTGKMLDGSPLHGNEEGAIGNWADVKAQAKQMLGIILTDADVHNVPLLLTDQYGKFIPSTTGYAQIVTAVDANGVPTAWVSGVAAGLPIPGAALRTGHGFLNDIAHHASPSFVDFNRDGTKNGLDYDQVADADVDRNGDGVYNLADLDVNGDSVVSTAEIATLVGDVNHNGVVNLADVDRNNDGLLTNADFDINGDGTVDGKDLVADDKSNNTYDNEMLDAHFVTGDGRGNENIALTTVHAIFHAEHNRAVEANKATILGSNDLAFLNEWLAVDVAALPTTQAQVDALQWDGERLFQAARFTTEMQYQHMVFEEFARRMQPMVEPFVFNSSPDVDPSIVAEFAHTVYRFGHSMLTGTVDRLDNNLDLLNGDADQQTLLAVFLNPQAYIGSGATVDEINGNIIRGLTRDVGNAIDEFIVTDVRSNLLGLPLDLAVLNITRGRETGIPSLNEARAELYNDTGLADLKPYESWADFALNIKNAASVVNFIAAYGTHPTIEAALTLATKRAAAEELVFGRDGPDADTTVPNDRIDFLNATGAWAPGGPNGDARGGLNYVDLWLGGLAEKSPEFGGMLGTTFNYVFEYQMEALQNGDRLYYLTRTQGLGFLNQLEPNTFTDIVMRNTDLGDIYSTHLNGSLFTTPDHIIELDRGIAQEDYNGAAAGRDPEWDGTNPTLEAILGAKVVRNYSGSGKVIVGAEDSVVNSDADPDNDEHDDHDVGAYLRVLGGEHYVLGGTEGNDRLYGDSGIDTLWGDGGNDYLNGMTESDDVFGGAGDDIIEDPFGDDVLRGNQGNDVITSSRGADLMFGDEGTDLILVGQDASEVFAGTGNDFVLGGNGKDFLLGNEGDDWMEGGGGFDTLAGDNSELFFNSPVIGHDVLFGHGDETDYDAESGDDIMGSGPSVYRYEGMFGFDWGIAKYDISGVHFDLQIPLFTTIPEDTLRDRFDQVEGLSGWNFGDRLDGDDRGHSGGSSSPDSTPVELFVDHLLTQEGLNRISGLQALLGGPSITSFKNGNILLGGDGNDFLRGRGGFDVVDGDAWLNVRIKIVHNGVTYSAESLTTDTVVAGPYAGKVYNINTDGSTNFNSVAFGGRSLNSLMLDRTLNPGDMSIVREVLYDNTNVTGAGRNVDTAIFQGGNLEYQIEGSTILYDSTGVAISRSGVIRDVNGDGFISVKDLDDGTVAAPGRVGLLTVSRGALTDDTDLLKNIERLQFADTTIQIAGTNQMATGTVTINDPTMFGTFVSPIVGQVLTATLSNFADVDGIPLNPTTGLPVGLTFEWQTTEAGNDGGWAAISQGLTYTVRSVDPTHVLRAVAIFKDAAGVEERINSVGTDNVTAPFDVLEHSPIGTVVAPTIPFSVDYDPLGLGGTGVTDGDIVQLTHTLADDAGGRFKIVNVGTAQAPVYQLQVADASLLDYESDPDHAYEIVINSYTDTDLASLIAARQFTVRVANAVVEDIRWNGDDPASNTALPGANAVIANLTSRVDGALPVSYSLLSQSSSNFSLSSGGVFTRLNSAMSENTTYTFSVRATTSAGSRTETFTIKTGTAAANQVSSTVGTDGDDAIYALAGDDVLTGQAGDDSLYGQAGNDRLIGGAGADIMDGGDGTDTADYSGSNAAVSVNRLLDTASGGHATGDALDSIENVIGSAFGDVLVGNDGANVLSGGNGDDTLAGGLGADTLNGDDGIDTADYSSSNVAVTVNRQADTATGGHAQGDSLNSIENVIGSAFNDSLTGNGSDNLLSGGAGQDLLNGAAGNDRIFGGANSDTITQVSTEGRDIVDGGTTGAGPADTSTDTYILNGVAGTETFRIYSRTAFLLANPGAALQGGTEIVITRNGTNNAAVIAELDNIEEIRANSNSVGSNGGDNIIVIGSFAGTSLNLNTVTIDGDDGDDIVDISGLVSDHRIVFKSNGGNDTIIGTLRTEDVIELPVGSDLADYITETVNGVTIISNGQDSVTFTSSGSPQIRVGNSLAFSDVVRGIYYQSDLMTSDTMLDGGGGVDTLVLQGNYDLSLNASSLVGFEGISLQSGSLTRWGQAGTATYQYRLALADENVGAGQQFRVNAQSLIPGESLLFDGSAETDGKFLVYAGHGDDDFTGGMGNDIFFFEAGRFGPQDKVDGGGGRDAVVISGIVPAGANPIHIDVGAGGFTNVESLSFNARFASAPGVLPSYEVVLANGNIAAGSELIINGSSLAAGQFLSFDGSGETAGALLMYGGAGLDTFHGGAQADLLFAAGGADTLSGGAGADSFEYRSVSDSTLSASDRILDFVGGEDKIDLSFMDANATEVGNQAFNFVGSAAFGNNAGELRAQYTAVSNEWALEGDVDGDGAADFQIIVATMPSNMILVSDFIL